MGASMVQHDGFQEHLDHQALTEKEDLEDEEALPVHGATSRCHQRLLLGLEEPVKLLEDSEVEGDAQSLNKGCGQRPSLNAARVPLAGAGGTLVAITTGGGLGG